MRELWAQALYALESWREPLRLAHAGYWLAVLVLYALLARTVQSDDAAEAARLGLTLADVAAAAVLLAGASWLSARMPLRTPLAWLVHALASLTLAVLYAVVMQRATLRSGIATSQIAGAAGLYWLFLGVRWAYGSLRGPEPEAAVQLVLDLVRVPAGVEQHREDFVVRRAGRDVVVPARDVDWIQAAGREVVLHLGRDSYRLRESMQAVEQSLDPHSFVRVHRSRIVNLDRIRAIYPWAYGDFRILMQDGSIVNFSRRYRSRMEELIG